MTAAWAEADVRAEPERDQCTDEETNAENCRQVLVVGVLAKLVE